MFGESQAIAGWAVPLWAQRALGAPPLALERQWLLSQSGNEVYRACMPDGSSRVLRISPHARAFVHTGANLAVLRELGLPVQTVLAEGATPTGAAFIVLDWLPGRDLYYALPELSGAQAARIAATVTDFQRRVGARETPAQGGFGWVSSFGARRHRARWTDIFGEPAPRDVHVEMRDRPGATPLDHCRGRLGLLRASLEDYFATLAPVCFLHDLTIKNVLVQDGELSGLIDFDSVCYGDPLMVPGVTLAHLEADVGEAGRAYGEALMQCWRPQGAQMRATAFYASLWATGFLSIAHDAGDAERVRALVPVVERFLSLGEGAA
ncbi:aminoglycoside phosphotransferase family protein [Paraburkholderia sp. J76]|uniref:phosphotransferase family protein n=1 Tax=Paraburkholderia sp. J76 TaxID=2805439 RepID=UPI002ABD98BB|nr:aminoglycoside phosphotransferase family protein [Paraburkholderia sp. J76]